MQVEGIEGGEDYRSAARQALVEIPEGRMHELIDQHLERMAELGEGRSAQRLLSPPLADRGR